MELNIAKYETASLINDIAHINMMRSSKFVEFELDVDENIPSKFLGDELRIKQILNNLLSNAYKYTEEGVIKLSVHTEAATEDGHDTLVFCVSDTGQGMTEEQISTIFTTEYSRFNQEVNRSVEGTGLGMNITWRLVRMMNGMISVESQPGKGTKFTVRLPQQRASSNVLGKELTEKLRNFRISSSAQMKRAKITREYMPYGKVLIVDDVYSNLYVAKGLMSPYGLSIDTATSGAEAIEKVKAGELYDIIFMDHMMPKMDGVEATKIIRELGYTKPIVALTANALTGQAEMFIKNGFDEFISKPIDIRQLNMVLNKLIRDKYPQEVVDAARKQKDLAAGRKKTQEIDSQLLAFFISDAKKAIGVLEAIYLNKCRRSDDVSMFIINVHAMKSALANVGEKELSNEALVLEQMGRDNDIKLLLEKLPFFLESLYKVIANFEEKEHKIKKEGFGDYSQLKEKLNEIRIACGEYNKKAAKDLLAELKTKEWSDTVNEHLDVLAEFLLHSELTKL